MERRFRIAGEINQRDLGFSIIAEEVDPEKIENRRLLEKKRQPERKSNIGKETKVLNGQNNVTYNGNGD